MELLLIRHALPLRVENADTAADPALDPKGVLQAERLAEYLREEQIDAVWSSPMTRARQTASPLSTAFGQEIKIEDGIAEWDRNSTSYIPIEELKRDFPEEWKAMALGQWDSDIPMDEFHDTVFSSIERLIAEHPGQRIAVVCHGGVINAYIARILGLANSGGFFMPDYTSVHRVMAAQNGVRSLRSLNETHHLRGTGLLNR